MKSAHLLPVLLVIGASSARADILGSFDSLLGRPRPDYDPASLQPTSPDDGQKRSPNSPADSDLGDQRILGTYNGLPPVRADISTALYYTNNAPSRTVGLEKSSWLWDSRAAVSWQPRIAAGWFADLGLSEEVFQYSHFSATDFEFFEAHAGVVKLLPNLDDLIVFGRLEYQQLNPDEVINPQYDATRARVGAQKLLWSAARQQLTAGASAAFDIFGSPAALKRNEVAIDLAYTYAITSSLSARAVWQGAWWSFDKAGRDDFHQLAAVELSWRIRDNARIFTSLSYTRNDSNSPAGLNDFESWQTGVGAGMTIQF